MFNQMEIIDQNDIIVTQRRYVDCGRSSIRHTIPIEQMIDLRPKYNETYQMHVI